MNLITKAMNVRFLIRLYYDRTPSRNIRTSPCESVLFHGAVSGEPDSLATSGCIPESLDEAVSLAKSLGLMDSIRSEKDPARAVEMTVDYFRLRGFLPTTPPSQV